MLWRSTVLGPTGMHTVHFTEGVPTFSLSGREGDAIVGPD